jgi:hypothetical protein
MYGVLIEAILISLFQLNLQNLPPDQCLSCTSQSCLNLYGPQESAYMLTDPEAVCGPPRTCSGSCYSPETR